jgi:hypothetical protein
VGPYPYALPLSYWEQVALGFVVCLLVCFLVGRALWWVDDVWRQSIVWNYKNWRQRREWLANHPK